MVQVVETIVADSMAELRSHRDRGTAADLVELRLDGVRDLDVRGALEGRTRPVIATCRSASEGGRFDGSEEERLAFLEQAASLGAEYVDVEWKSPASVLARCAALTRVVVSNHDFEGMPADLGDRVSAMTRAGGHVVKVAVTPHTLADCVTLRDAVKDVPERVAIAMGAAGQLTRVFPAWIGSKWTYGGRAAPGQVSTQTLIESYRVRERSRDSLVYAVAGSPLGHSASPAMHNAAFGAFGIDAVYVPLQTSSASDLLVVADAIGLEGASVTIPLKQPLLACGVDADELSKNVGAINTLKRDGRGWQARNFDVAGFLAPFAARRIDLRGKRALVLGAGGAARAAVWGLRSQGAEVRVAARRPEAARALTEQAGGSVADWPPPSDWNMLVNTTPIGMWPRVGESPVDRSVFDRATGAIVYDLVYNPVDTELLQMARAAGAETIDGLEMLVGQACHQFEWWTGRQAPRDVMAVAAKEFMKAL
jgi:3-dehydroquinate dehydratase/shikimate dehydrogenase